MYTPRSGEVVRIRDSSGEFYVTQVNSDAATADLIRISGIPSIRNGVPLGRIRPRREGGALEMRAAAAEARAQRA